MAVESSVPGGDAAQRGVADVVGAAGGGGAPTVLGAARSEPGPFGGRGADARGGRGCDGGGGAQAATIPRVIARRGGPQTARDMVMALWAV